MSIEDRILFLTKILKFDDRNESCAEDSTKVRIKKAKEQRRVAAEKQSCLETARSFTFRANLPNEKRGDEIR